MLLPCLPNSLNPACSQKLSKTSKNATIVSIATTMTKKNINKEKKKALTNSLHNLIWVIEDSCRDKSNQSKFFISKSQTNRLKTIDGNPVFDNSIKIDCLLILENQLCQ